MCTSHCVCVPSSPGVSIQWEATAYTASEGSGAVQLVLLREGSADGNVSVQVTTVAGSATGKTGQRCQTRSEIVTVF